MEVAAGQCVGVLVHIDKRVHLGSTIANSGNLDDDYSTWVSRSAVSFNH